MRYIMLNKCIIFLILILFALSFKSSIASDFKFAAAAGLASYDFHNDWEALKTPLMGGVEWTKVKNLPLGIFIAPVIGYEKIEWKIIGVCSIKCLVLLSALDDGSL